MNPKKITPITLKTIYHLCQLAPRVCTPEGKGRICCRLATTTTRPSVLTMQSRTRIGQECLKYPIFFSHRTIIHHATGTSAYPLSELQKPRRTALVLVLWVHNHLTWRVHTTKYAYISPAICGLIPSQLLLFLFLTFSTFNFSCS